MKIYRIEECSQTMSETIGFTNNPDEIKPIYDRYVSHLTEREIMTRDFNLEIYDYDGAETDPEKAFFEIAEAQFESLGYLDPTDTRQLNTLYFSYDLFNACISDGTGEEIVLDLDYIGEDFEAEILSECEARLCIQKCEARILLKPLFEKLTEMFEYMALGK